MIIRMEDGDKIGKLLMEIFDEDINFLSYRNENVKIMGYPSHISYLKNSTFIYLDTSDFTIEIIKSDDEYYFVSVYKGNPTYQSSRSNFRCDQFDGLKHCLLYVKNNLI